MRYNVVHHGSFVQLRSVQINLGSDNYQNGMRSLAISVIPFRLSS